MPTIDEEPTQMFKKAPTAPAPAAPAPPEAEVEEFYEDEPRRRPWAAIASVVLALAVIFTGYQWNQAASREHSLVAQLNALRADAEALRVRAEESQRQVEGLQKRIAAMAAEKTALAERVASLEKAAQEKTVAAKAPERPGPTAKVTPVVAKKKRG